MPAYEEPPVLPGVPFVFGASLSSAGLSNSFVGTVLCTELVGAMGALQGFVAAFPKPFRMPRNGNFPPQQADHCQHDQ